jgi:hypothetical protein
VARFVTIAETSLQSCVVGGAWPHLFRPFFSQEQFFDAIGMEEVVKRKMAEHDEGGIVAVFTVAGREVPLSR